jgi:hypothetical protein
MDCGCHQAWGTTLKIRKCPWTWPPSTNENSSLKYIEVRSLIHIKNELPSVLLNWNMTNGKDKNVRKSGDQLDIAGYKIDSMWNFHLSISGALEQSPSIVYWMKSSPWWVHSWHKYVHSWLKNWKVCVLWRRWYKIPKTMNIVDYKYLLFQLWFNKNSKSIIPFDSCFDGRSASLLPKKSVTWAL